MTDNQDVHGNIYQDYITQGITDVNTLKKDMMVSSSQVSEAILNISKLSNTYDIGYASGGYVSSGNISVPPGINTIIYSGNTSGRPYSVVAGGGGGGSSPMANWVEGSYTPLTVEPVDTEALAERIVTQYVPGNPLVICFDNEFTSEQVNEITGQLIRHNIEAVLIRGARAGTGRPSPGYIADEGKRIDILARLAETWERHPDLTFAELIRWWNGENMTDADFAAATDVYAKKVYE